MKINFEGGLDQRSNYGGLGIVIRDSNGSFKAARAIHLQNIMEPVNVMLEAMAARESLFFAQRSLVYQRFISKGTRKNYLNDSTK